MTNLKDRLKQLDELLDLIQTDVDDLTPPEKRKFLIRSSVFGGQYYPAVSAILLGMENEIKSYDLAKMHKIMRERVTRRMNILKKFLSWLGEHLQSNYYLEFQVLSSLSWSEIEGFSLQERTPQEPISPFSLLSRTQKDAREQALSMKGLLPEEPTLSVKVFKPGKGLLSGETKQRKLIKEFTLSEEFIVLAKALNGIPIHHLKCCEYDKCNKLFVQTTKREKRFCSTRCQNTVAVRKHRKNPKKK